MKESNSRREFLSQSGKMVTAAALFGTSVPLAHAAASDTIHCEANNTMKITDPHYYLDNVLLENGFDYENGGADPHGAPDRGDSGRQNCCAAREQAASGRHAAAL